MNTGVSFAMLEREADHLHPSSADIKIFVELDTCSSICRHGVVLRHRDTLPLYGFKVRVINRRGEIV
jgi:hypothetical protein